MAGGLTPPPPWRILLAAVSLCGGCMTVELPPATPRPPRETPPAHTEPPPIVHAPVPAPPLSAPAPKEEPAAEPAIVPSPPPPAPERHTLPPDFGARATEVALGMLGRPYRMGGFTPAGFDCSGLVYYSYGQLGVSVPRDTQSLRDITTVIPDRLRRVGDLVFFHIHGRQYSHVGLYLGEGRFLHAPASGGEVRIEKLSVSYWTKRYAGTRRLNFAPANPGL